MGKKPPIVFPVLGVVRHGNVLKFCKQVFCLGSVRGTHVCEHACGNSDSDDDFSRGHYTEKWDV